MQPDYWQRTEELDDAPRAEDHTIVFRSDQERWLAPRFEERWVLQKVSETSIARRGKRERPSK